MKRGTIICRKVLASNLELYKRFIGMQHASDKFKQGFFTDWCQKKRIGTKKAHYHEPHSTKESR